MTSRENAHIDYPRYVLAPGAIIATNTAALDTIGFESAAILAAIAPGNLSASVTASYTLQEADLVGGVPGPFTAVDPMFVEWFQDGIPGTLTGAAGSQVWTPGLPGYNGVLTLNTETGITGHVYAVSYVGGLHRFIRLAVAITGVPSNVATLFGLLDSPKETAIHAYTNADKAFPNVAFPAP